MSATTFMITAAKNCQSFSHFCEVTSHTPPRCRNKQHSSPTETLTYRAPWSNAYSKLLLYEGVVDPLGNVMEGFSIIRADETRKESFFFLTICWEGWLYCCISL